MMEIKSNSKTHITDPKPRRSLRLKSSEKYGGESESGRKRRRIQSWKLGRHKLPDLPLDVKVNIISRLPLKSVIRCKSLSKALNNLISEPQFSQICLTNRSNYFSTLFVDTSKSRSLHLLEFDKRDIYNMAKRKSKSKSDNLINKVAIFNLDRLPGGTRSSPNDTYFSVWGYCKGLFCLLKVESGLHNLFVTNPVLGQFIQLPEPVGYYSNRLVYLAYGIGHCQITNRYKVLRIITKGFGSGKCKTDSQIFTVGSDQKWRSLSDVNVPYNIMWGVFGPNPQSPMVALHSALHWVVQPVIVPGTAKRVNLEPNLEPNWGTGTMCICAFDVTGENVTALPLPPVVAATLPPPVDAANPPFCGCLTVLLDKLCVWQVRIYGDFELWVMDDYGIHGSWTRQFILKSSTLPCDIKSFKQMPPSPLTGSLHGVIMVTDGYQVVLYDLNEEKCLRVINKTKDAYYYPITFVPGFVSLKNLVQG